MRLAVIAVVMALVFGIAKLFLEEPARERHGKKLAVKSTGFQFLELEKLEKKFENLKPQLLKDILERHVFPSVTTINKHLKVNDKVYYINRNKPENENILSLMKFVSMKMNVIYAVLDQNKDVIEEIENLYLYVLGNSFIMKDLKKMNPEVKNRLNTLVKVSEYLKSKTELLEDFKKVIVYLEIQSRTIPFLEPVVTDLDSKYQLMLEVINFNTNIKVSFRRNEKTFKYLSEYEKLQKQENKITSATKNMHDKVVAKSGNNVNEKKEDEFERTTKSKDFFQGNSELEILISHRYKVIEADFRRALKRVTSSNRKNFVFVKEFNQKTNCILSVKNINIIDSQFVRQNTDEKMTQDSNSNKYLEVSVGKWILHHSKLNGTAYCWDEISGAKPFTYNKHIVTLVVIIIAILVYIRLNQQ